MARMRCRRQAAGRGLAGGPAGAGGAQAANGRPADFVQGHTCAMFDTVMHAAMHDTVMHDVTVTDTVMHVAMRA